MISQKRLFSIFFLCFFFLLFSNVQAQPGDYSVDIEGYAETAGTFILKFQEIFMSVLEAFSFGVFSEGGTVAFTQFLLMAMVFLIVQGMVGFLSIIPEKLRVVFSIAVTILSFLFIDVGEIQLMLSNYEALGIVITVVLPVLIIMSFSFRMYQKAYDGRGNKSPFYVGILNLVFLTFFGIFLIRYSFSEEGTIAFLRFLSGWFLIVLGFSQILLFKIVSIIFRNWRKEGNKLKREIKEIKRKNKEEIAREREKAGIQ